MPFIPTWFILAYALNDLSYLRELVTPISTSLKNYGFLHVFMVMYDFCFGLI